MDRRRFIQIGTLSAAAAVVPGAVAACAKGAGGAGAEPTSGKGESQVHREMSASSSDPGTMEPADVGDARDRDLGPNGDRGEGRFLELQGGPQRKSCSGLVHYNGVPFDRMAEDMILHRMPSDWRDRFILGIPEPGKPV